MEPTSVAAEPDGWDACAMLEALYPVFGEGGSQLGLGGVVTEVTDRYEATEREHAALLQAETARARAEALRRRDAVQFCSAVHGRIRPAAAGGLDVHLLGAGHPPPLVLRREGAVEVPGTLLTGVTPDTCRCSSSSNASSTRRSC
jgi:hypothetical protein